MVDFISELLSCRHEDTYLPFYPEFIQGYTQQEINQIAEIYNLDIHGQFQEFLLQMGRCSGGLLWGTVSMYRYSWNREAYRGYQKVLDDEDEINKPAGWINAIENKLFPLTRENEGTQFAYLATALKNDYVWLWDDGQPESEFSNTGSTLLEYFKWLVKYETKQARFEEKESNFEKDKKYITGRLLD